jgi:hypothetical protein
MLGNRRQDRTSVRGGRGVKFGIAIIKDARV